MTEDLLTALYAECHQRVLRPPDARPPGLMRGTVTGAIVGAERLASALCIR